MKDRIIVWFVRFLAAAIVILAIVFVIWLRRNTSIISPTPTPQQVVENNENFPETGEDFFAGFVAKTLVVPDSLKVGVFAEPRTLNLPADFDISLFAANIDTARFLHLTIKETCMRLSA
jgi:hypothetical protein